MILKQPKKITILSVSTKPPTGRVVKERVVKPKTTGTISSIDKRLTVQIQKSIETALALTKNKPLHN